MKQGSCPPGMPKRPLLDRMRSSVHRAMHQRQPKARPQRPAPAAPPARRDDDPGEHEFR